MNLLLKGNNFMCYSGSPKKLLQKLFSIENLTLCFFDPYFNWYPFITHLPSTTSNFKYKKKKNQVLAGHFDPEKVKEEKKKIFC